MPDNRFFYPGTLEHHAQISLDEDEMHHMVTIMRRKEGDNVELINGKGIRAEGKIEKISRNKVLLLIKNTFQEELPKRELILAAALLRPSLLDWVVEKGTELGATSFWLFPGIKSEKSTLTPNQKKRLTLLSISALKQSGRLYLPSIDYKPSLQKWEKPNLPLFFGDPKGGSFQRSSHGAIIVIGPSKGLSKEEKTHLTHLGASAISFNPHILRAETAALCALSLFGCI